MKYMIISDIHGMTTNLPVIKDKLDDCDKLIVLGDLYYPEFRNRLSPYYDPEYIKAFLITEKEKLICLKGNCDRIKNITDNAFPMENIIKIDNDSYDIYATHGHLYNNRNWHHPNSILLFGHYHIPFITKSNSNIFVNPGSISVPRGKEKPSYAILTEKDITIYDIDGQIIDQMKL